MCWKLISKMIFFIIYLLLPLNIVISTTHTPQYETTQIPTESDSLSNLENNIDNSPRNKRDTQPEVGTTLHLSPMDTAPVIRRAYKFPPKGLLEMLINRNSLIDQRFV